MSFILNIIFAFFVTIFIRKKENIPPVWLIAFNLFWLVFQVIYYLFSKY